MALDINYLLPSLTSLYSITPLVATLSFLNTYAPNMPKTFSSANTATTPKAGNQILALGVGMATDYFSNMLTGDMFGDSYLGSTIGLAFSNTLSSAGNTISNNLLKGNTLTQGLGLNIGSSLSGVVAGVAGDLIGKGVTSLMGDSKLGKGIGAGLANGISSFGGTVLSNLVNGKAALDGFKGITLAGRAAIKAKSLADAAKTGMSFLLATKAALTAANAAKFASWANIGGLAGSAVGAALSAVTGPSKEYSGKYGNVTLIADTAYDVAQMAAGFMGPVGAIISGGMALNKGLSNIFGSTDGMTTQDAILGSAWAGAPVKWLNMWGSSKTGTFNKQSWQNSEKTSNFMGSSFGNLADRFKKAREEAGKVYGTFSLGAKKEAQENIDFANRAWDKILAMANLDEYQNVRSRDMASINNLRYAQNILGGFTPLLIGKMGMKILNNTIDHNRGMRYLSAAALIDNKALILSAGNGIKISKLLLGKDIVYSDNTRVSRPDVMLPIQRKLKPGLQFFTRGGQTVVVLPTHAEISQDNRTKLQHLESHKKSVLVRLLKLMEKALKKTAKVAEAVLEKTSPSYWVELVTGEDLGTAGRLGVDLVSPYVIGKGIQLLGKAGRGLNKLATLGTSSYTGKWTLFGNRYYRFKPGYIGMNGVPVESRTTDSKLMNTINNSQGIIIGSHPGSPVSFIESPKITAENAASITPELDATYKAAVESGDRPEALRLLEQAYLRSGIPRTDVTVTPEGHAVGWYHGSEWGNHTIFDSSAMNATIGGTSAHGRIKGNFLTTDVPSAMRYAGSSRFSSASAPEYTSPTTFGEKIKSLFGRYKPRRLYPAERIGNYAPKPERLFDTEGKAPINHLDKTDNVVYPMYVNPGEDVMTLDFQGNPWSQSPVIFPNNFYLKRHIRDDIAKIYRDETIPYRDYGAAYKAWIEDPINIRHGRTSLDKEYFDAGTRSIEGFNSAPRYERVRLVEELVPNTTNGAVQTAAKEGKTSVLMRNVIDSNGGPEGVGYAIDDFVTLKPNQQKLADITYDDNGRLIPLSQRFNWSKNDIRYGLLPFLGLGTAATLYNKTK